jgi:hypothetical protein
VGVLISRISGLSTWESQEKWYLDATPMATHKEKYKAEGGGFLEVWAMSNLMSPCMPAIH